MDNLGTAARLVCRFCQDLIEDDPLSAARHILACRRAAAPARIRIDLTGQRFGRLTVLRLDKENRNQQRTWWVRCDCGAELTARTPRLLFGEDDQCKACDRRAKRGRPAVILVGGIGKNKRYYRHEALKVGWVLDYCETGPLPDSCAYSVVLIFTDLVSHKLRDSAVALARKCAAPIRYLRGGGAGAVRRALVANAKA